MGGSYVKALGVSEVRWTESGEVQYKMDKFIYSRGDRYERGAFVILSGENG